MKRFPIIVATLAALLIILMVSCTEAKVPTTSSEISQSFSALAQLFSAEQPDLEAQATTADAFAKTPEALAVAKDKAKTGKAHERAAAAAVLARIQDPKAVEQLCEMIDDDSKLARNNVYVALQRHNTSEARTGLSRAVAIHGLEDGLANVICEMIILSTTSEMEFEFEFDPETINELIASAKDHQFETEHFDTEEFTKKMEEFGRTMEEKFAHRDEAEVKIKIKVDESDSGPTIS